MAKKMTERSFWRLVSARVEKKPLPIGKQHPLNLARTYASHGNVGDTAFIMQLNKRYFLELHQYTWETPQFIFYTALKGEIENLSEKLQTLPSRGLRRKIDVAIMKGIIRRDRRLASRL